MVTRTRTRGTAASRPAASSPSLVSRLRALPAHVRSTLAGVAGPERLRREAVGLVLIVVAIVSAAILGRGGDEGRLTGWWWGTLTTSFGWLALLVPVLLLLAGLRILATQDGPVLEVRHYLGGFLFVVAVVGLVQLGATLDRPEAGGYLGFAVATLLAGALGELGAGPALFVCGVLGIFLLVGSDLQTFASDLRALGRLVWRFALAVAGLFRPLARRLRPDPTARRVLPAIEPGPSDEPTTAAASGIRRAAHVPASAAHAAGDAARPGSAPLGPRRASSGPAFAQTVPVINIPPRAATDGVAGDAHASTAQQDGENGGEPRSAAVEAILDPATGEGDEPGGQSVGQPSPLLRVVPGGRAGRSVRSRSAGSGPAARPAGPPAQSQTDDEPEVDDESEPEASAPQTARPTMVSRAAEAVAARRTSRSPRATPMPLPDLTRLRYYDDVVPDADDLQRKAVLIEETLASFRVDARVREINPGPAVTQFALEPGNGVKVRRITELQNDLALALAAPSIRIEAPVPGMARVGLEIPNDQIATVGLRETLESPAFSRRGLHLPIPLGQDVNGRYVVGDLTKMPHLLIAGATGSGKSVCLNGIISTFLLSRGPDDLKLVMIDPKTVELSGYNGVPHLQCPVVTDMDKVVAALRLTVQEMERRYAVFSRLGVRNLDGYRMKVADEPDAEPMPYLVVIIDELADLMMTTPDEVETLLCRITQKARACGIHMIIATQRPSVDVITGLIKANVPSRIAFAVSSLTDSRVVLDLPGAERLLGRGDMLYLPPDAAKPQRIQGAFIDDRDVQYVVDHWHDVAPVPHYPPEWLELPSSSGPEEGDGDDDPLWDQAMEIVRTQGTASASMLQRRLRIGYNRAARIIERMEDEGVIGPADGLRGRPVLVGDG